MTLNFTAKWMVAWTLDVQGETRPDIMPPFQPHSMICFSFSSCFQIVEEPNNVVDLQSSERLLDPDTRPKQFDELLEKYSVISIEVGNALYYFGCVYFQSSHQSKNYLFTAMYSDQCQGKAGLDRNLPARHRSPHRIALLHCSNRSLLPL